MNRKKMYLASIGSVMILALFLCVSSVLAQVCVNVNTHVDGAYCKNKPSECCHVFTGKEYVWLNGSDGFLSDGYYFFAVLSPDGILNPNDGGSGNLSDDYDCYLNRIFTVTNGEVSAYSGNSCGGTYPFQSRHWLDNGVSGAKPNWQPPYIRLYPYVDTTNSGGIYTMAVCSLDQGYPVDPSSCSYSTFRIK